MSKLIGKDCFGNKYYETSSGKRIIEYLGSAEPTKMDSDWHPWMHYYGPQPEIKSKKQLREPNLTGTQFSYHPNRTLSKRRSHYESWRP